MAKNFIYLVPTSPVFNKEFVKPFEGFSADDSQLLYSSLYLNQVEVLSKFNETNETYFCIDEKDEGYVPSEINPEKILSVNTQSPWQSLIKIVSPVLQQNASNAIFIPSNSIGMTASVFQKVLNLLNNDDNNIVVAKADNRITFFGVNYFDEILMSELKSTEMEYDDFLKLAGKLNGYLFTVNGSLVIENVQDFRNLYKILSTKQSIEFCSHEKHELFTHLFVEYKDLL